MALKHPVFNGPYTVELDRETIDTPKHYADYYQKNPLPSRLNGWRVHDDFKGEDGEVAYGSIASGSGFEDTPDAEVISLGVNSKSPHSVAIGRHGNFLMWGFAGGPKVMTPSAKDVFANSVVYISKFDRQFPKQRRLHGGRDWWIQEAFNLEKIKANRAAWLEKIKREGKSQAYIDRFGSPDSAASDRAKKLFPRLHEKFGIDNLQLYLEALLENRDYLYAEMGEDRYGIPVYVDEDCVAYDIPNHDPKLIEHCVSLLEKKQDTERAMRVLKRYTGRKFETTEQWREWFDKVQGSLYFTDTGGFRFCSDKVPLPEKERPAPTNSWGSNIHPVGLSASVIPTAGSPGKATLTLKIEIKDGWHIYDTAPEGSPYKVTSLKETLPDSVQAIGPWQRPKSQAYGDDESLTVFTNEVEFSLPISAETESDLLNKMFITVNFQACTDEFCMRPERAFTGSEFKASAKKNQEQPTAESRSDVADPEPTIEAEFIATDITNKTKGFRPMHARLSDDLDQVEALPEGLENPRVGTFNFGNRSWMFVLDETKGKEAKLFVDANQDGDLTNDPAPDYAVTTEGDHSTINGSAKLNWNDGQLVSIKFYRNKSKRFKNSLSYYADFGHKFTLTMDGRQFSAVHAGVPDKRLGFEVDRNGDDVIHRELEVVKVGTPFNYTGTTYLLSVKDGNLTIGKADAPIEPTRLPQNFSIGQTVPQFTAKTLDGEQVNFPNGYAGKIVMLDIWATWCVPCVMDIPHMKAAYDQWHEAGFEIVGVSLDEQKDMKKFRQLVADKEVEWSQIAEGDGFDGRLGTMFEVTAVPFMLLVDGDTGKIIGTTKETRGKKLSAFVGEQIKKKNKTK